jgi:GTP pyrophosphokinase
MATARPPAAPSLQALLAEVRTHRQTVDEDLLRRAFEFTRKAHEGQFRLTGEPYVCHPLEAAKAAAQIGLDDQALAAALLHDTIEDTSTTLEELQQQFGPEIAGLVDGVTKLGRIHFRTREEQRAENLRKMLLAMCTDLRIIVIKMCDRLHNMRTLRPLPPDKQQGIALETLQIFAPLAHRLGVWRLKWELEDLSLRYLEPTAYRQIVRKLAQSRAERERIVSDAVQVLQRRLDQIGIAAEVSGRTKHIHSIYQKMKTQGVDYGQILDLQALRVIVPTLPQCYSALGVVHALWPPMDAMFHDHISRPKPNMYQSLHTKVTTPAGPMEVQIRTQEMHRTAEYGIASHWRYKEQVAHADETFEQKLAWLRRLLELHADAKDTSEWLESLKVDLFKDQVFVFTPKGDVIDLPVGSTPIDFAYRIHTDIGHRCTGARVNGAIVNLDHKLSNGDVVEIMVSKGPGRPSLDWLNIAVTPQARSKIKQWYRRQSREENIHTGRAHLEQECRRYGVAPMQVLQPEAMQELAERMNYASVDDLLAAVGYGDVASETVIGKLRQATSPPSQPVVAPHEKARRVARRAGISISGLQDLLVTLSRCCSPVPGDAIAGYVTRGKGVAVHRTDCPNLIAAQERESERILSLDWAAGQDDKYAAAIEIEAADRVGLLNDLLAVTSADNINIVTAKARIKKRSRTAVISLVLEVSSRDQLDGLLQQFRRRPDVIRAGRIGGAHP